MSDTGFSDAEKAAMKERAAELRAQKGGKKKEQNLQAVVDAIEAMPNHDKQIGAGLHRLVTEVAPELEAKTWYGMPAYALDGAVLIFLQASAKFETRYSTIGFNDNAALDDGSVWPTSFAVTEWSDAVADQFRERLERALGR